MLHAPYTFKIVSYCLWLSPVRKVCLHFPPGDQHSRVMVSDPIVWYGVTVAAPVLDGFLPFTEAV